MSNGQSNLERALRELVEKWREEAAIDKAQSRDINERLRRGEVVNMTASTVGSIEGFIEFTDYREKCADELAALLAAPGPELREDFAKVGPAEGEPESYAAAPAEAEKRGEPTLREIIDFVRSLGTAEEAAVADILEQVFILSKAGDEQQYLFHLEAARAAEPPASQPVLSERCPACAVSATGFCAKHPPAPEASSKSITIEATTSTQTMASGMMYLAMREERESKERDRELIRKGVSAGLEEAAKVAESNGCKPGDFIVTEGEVQPFMAGISKSMRLIYAAIRALDPEAIARKVERVPGPQQICSKCGKKTWSTTNGLCDRCSPNVNAAPNASP